jgi:type II secretory pathway component PulF
VADVIPTTPPLPSEKRFGLQGVLLVILIPLNYVFQATVLLKIIPTFHEVFREISFDQPLPFLTRVFFEASTIAVLFYYPTILVCAALAVCHDWLFFKGGQTQRRWAVRLMVIWFLILLAEVTALCVPAMIAIASIMPALSNK